MSALVPCPSCARHVRASEASCPFCASALPEGLTAVPNTTRRLSRFAAFTFAAAVVVTGAMTVGCSGSDEGGEGQSEGQLGGIMPMYGAPVPHHDAGTGGCTDDDNGSLVAMYGIPPWPSYDAGHVATDAGAPCAHDGGAPAQDGGGFHAMYGAPPTFDAGGFHALYGLPPD
jgi:hypothetical protein